MRRVLSHCPLRQRQVCDGHHALQLRRSSSVAALARRRGGPAAPAAQIVVADALRHPQRLRPHCVRGRAGSRSCWGRVDSSCNSGVCLCWLARCGSMAVCK
jgi:hypothetical protein